MWKDFFFFSRKQRAGILLLLIILVATVVARILLPLFFVPDFDLRDPALEAEIIQFQAELDRRDSLRKVNLSEQREVKDSLRLAHYDSVLALSDAIRRAKFDSVRDYWNKRRRLFKDSIESLKKKKVDLSAVPAESRLLIQVNSSDTTDLFQIPGIRKFILRSLWFYKEKLGGFISFDQFSEIYNIKPEEIEILKQNLLISPIQLKKIHLNRASVAELKAHPYLNFYQAKALYDFRRKKGKIRSESDLKTLTFFTQNELNKILPYLLFSE